MCGGNGIGHWIMHSPITPPDSSAPSRFANVRLPSGPRTVSSAEFPSRSGRARRLSRRTRECATS
jgi:hypothetical protein